ncbi:hypothetical protein VUR80DRAFT_5707 [Thermomyces stellatus]
MPRVSLRQGLDRDIYQLVRKFEDEQEHQERPSRLTITAIYDYIRGSNSSLSRLKRKPLEDSIERVLRFRKQDLQDQESEGEAEVEEQKEAAPKPAGDLLNRQLARRWKLAERKVHQSSEPEDNLATHYSTNMNGSKKRRISKSPPPTDATRATSGDQNDTGSQMKPPAPKRAKGYKGYHVLDSPDAPPVGGMSNAVEDFEKRLWFQMVRCGDKEDDPMDGDKRKPPIRPLLLSGPLGCGKSTLLQHLACRWKVPLVTVDCEFLATSDRVEKSLSDVYEDALAMAPCIIQLKKFDILWQSESSGQVQPGAAKFHVRELLSRFSRSQDPRRPIAIAATTRHPESVPAEFFKNGLLRQTYAIKAPNPESRLEILQVLGEEYGCQALDYTPIARLTHGYVADDLQNLFETGVIQAEAEDRPMTIEDLEHAAKDHVPHLRREGFSQIPEITLEQVGGLRDVIQLLRSNIINRIKNPDIYKSVKKYAGVLLWGPPGCGKTFVAQAIANAAQASFILVNGPELLDKYVGESERKIRALFTRARASTPCLIFLDEIDSLVPRRDTSSTEAGARVVNTILTELDGARDRAGVYVIAATNRPDMIDPAMFRTGRFNHKVFVDVPGEDERVDILKTIFRSREIKCDIAVAEEVARDPRCAGFSGADLSELSDRAVTICLDEALAEVDAGRATMGEPTLTRKHWEMALSKLRPSVKDLEMYRALAAADDLGVE